MATRSHSVLADLVDYEWLTGSAAAGVLEQLTLASEPVHRQLSRLRKTLSADRARLAVQQVELRQRAVTKFGNLAAEMFFTDVSLQQATDRWIARYKASRLCRAAPYVDYCCGIGGDLLAFAGRGPTAGWDRAPEIAHLANANLRAAGLEATSRVFVGEVESQTPGRNEIWHLDPDRRVAGRRTTQIKWQSPGPDLVDRWLAASPNGILKLAPATVVPDSWSSNAELEWISQNRECRQQIAWFGESASAVGHRATALLKNPANEHESLAASFAGSPNVAASLTEKVCRYVFDTDPALRAAGLTGALAVDQGLCALKSGASYLISDHASDHPLLTCFEVLEQLPLREKTLSKRLQSLNIGQLEIKKRGVDTDPEQLRKKLKLQGDESATLLLTRIGTSEIALLARRLEG